MLDEAIRLMPKIERYLKQDRNEATTLEKSLAHLNGIFSSAQRFEDEDPNE